MQIHAQHHNIEAALKALEQYFSNRFSRNISIRQAHSHNVSALTQQCPDAVVYVKNCDEVVQVVKICKDYKIPIIAFGAGSSLEGQLNAPFGGISVDFSKMDAVVAFSQEDMTITVQPGMTREFLNNYLRDSGLFFPLDPGANASIGGMASTRASGTNAVRYGTMKDAVLSLKVVMADGRVITTASHAKKSAAGYDLTKLIVGSEGTLGLIVEITLKLHPIPEVIASGICQFSTIEDACNVVIEATQTAIPFARVELLDEFTVHTCNIFSKLNLPIKPTLCVEFSGDQTTIDNQIALFAEIAQNHGMEGFEYSTDPQMRANLWKARHNVYWAGVAQLKGCEVFSTDVCVPISKLAECVVATQKDLQENNLKGSIVGHVGDGNFHVLIGYLKGCIQEEEQVNAFTQRLAERAIAFNGTCTGEHGIGQRKAKYLRQELGDSVDFMFAIKQALDPENILNPGKYGF